MDAPIPEAVNIQTFMIVWDINLELKYKVDTIDVYTPLFSLIPNKNENIQWIRLLKENDQIRIMSNFSWMKELRELTTYMINPLTCTVLDLFKGFGKFPWNHSKWSEKIRFVFEVEIQCDTQAVQPAIWKRCITKVQTTIKENEVYLELKTKTATETVESNHGLSCVVKRLTENKNHKLYIEPETPSEQWNLLSVMLKDNENHPEWRYIHTTDYRYYRTLKKFEPLTLFEIYELITSIENMSEFEIVALTSIIKPKLTSANVTEELQQHHITANLEESFTTDKLCDITVQVGAVKIRAHKKILATESTILRDLCNEDEKAANIVVVDLDIGTIKQIIEFMYTGTVKQPIEAPEQLFGAACKYEVAGLKKFVVEQLIKTIDMENVINLLMFADRCEMDGLFNEILVFIRANYADFMKLEDLKSMFVMHPELAVKLFTRLI